MNGQQNNNTAFLDGSRCTVPTFWLAGGWSDCDGTCDAGVQTREVICTDFSGRKLDILECTFAGAAPPSQQPCRLANKPCVEYAYVPDYVVGYINAAVPATTATALSQTITVSNFASTDAYGSNFGVALVVNVAGVSGAALTGDVTFALTLNDGSSPVTGTLAATTSGACTSIGASTSSVTNAGRTVSTASQLVLSDTTVVKSTAPAFASCNTVGTLYAGNAYTFKDAALATAFATKKVNGLYTLTVTTGSASTIISWGISIYALPVAACTGQQYMVPPNMHGSCAACPTGTTATFASAAGFAAFDQCGNACGNQLSFTAPFQCTACPANTAAANGDSHQINVPSCTRCNSVTPQGSAACSTYCFAGYEGASCTPCGNGFF